MPRSSALRRAYLIIGLRRGFNLAQARMRSQAERWERKIDDLETEFEMLIDEVRSTRDERAVQDAVTERAMYPDAFLN